MPDNDFEEQVRQKMGALRLPPSDAVWDQVDRRLHGKNRRRRWIIWLPVLTGALALGGYLLFTGVQPSESKQLSTLINNSSTGKKDIHEKSSLTARPTTTNPDRTAGLLKDSATTSYKVVAEKSKVDLMKSNEGVNNSGLPKVNRPYIKSGDVQVLTSYDKPVSRKQLSKAARPAKASNANALTSGKVQAKLPDLIQPPELLNDPSDDLKETANDAASALEPAIVNGMPEIAGLINTFLAFGPGVPIQRLASQSQLHYHKKPWQWGLTFTAGRTSLSSGPFKNILGGTAYDYAGSNLSVGNGNYQGTASFPQPSTTRASKGFSAGAIMKKDLSEKLAVSFGLNYTFISTTNKVGKKADSLFQQNSSGNQRSFSPYFRAGNTDSYSNRYHFIELPVMLQARLTPKRRLPLYWDAGISFSTLINSNALHYDNTARLYYVDNGLLRKTQLSFITGFPVGLSSKKNFRLQAGPQLQYGISQILSKRTGSGNHFMFLGLKASLLLDSK